MPGVIAADGTVTPVAHNDTNVVLTATISKGSSSETRSFTLKVYGIFNVSGSISGLTADGLVIELNGEEELTIASGATGYAFTTNLIGGRAYRVVVKKHADNLRCSISNAEGTISGADIDADITCAANDYTAIFTKQDALDGVYLSSTGFGDVDGDGDLDMLVTGVTSTGSYITRLYFNDGNGNFTKGIQSSDGGSPLFTGVQYGSCDFGDVDDDGDLDLIVTGRNSTNSPVAILYINDGTGSFTVSPQSSTVSGTAVFAGMYSGTADFVDYDNDGDLDLLITGAFSSSLYTRLYRNNGSGGFSYYSAAGLADMAVGSASFADFNGDTYLDLVLTGYTSSGYYRAYLYINNKNGTFTKNDQSSDGTSAVFTGVRDSSCDVADVDGDGDLDVIVTGNMQSTPYYTAILYINDGAGSFTVSPQSSTVSGTAVFTGVYFGSSSFADVDGDGDMDLFINGYSASNGYNSHLYINDGSGNFTKESQSSGESVSVFEGTYYGQGVFADIDSDGDKDLIVTGYAYRGGSVASASLYRNDGRGRFSGIRAVRDSSQSYADVDGDGDLDLLVTGIDSAATPKRWSDLYLNDGKGIFYNSGAGLAGVQYGSSCFSDVDSDGDMDIIITGATAASTYITYLYINDGNGAYTKSEQSSDGSSALFTGVQYGSVITGDVDNDGDSDILVSGQYGASSGNDITKLYINDEGSFSVASTPFRALRNSSSAFADFDKDGDLDLVISGYNGSTAYTRIYTNGKINTNNKCFGGDYFEDLNVAPNPLTPSLTAVYRGSMNFFDANGDGWPDIFITGYSYSARLYTNNADEYDIDPFVYSAQSITGVQYSSSNAGDVDNDGDIDLVVTGYKSSSPYPSAYLYTNNGSGTFAVQSAGFTGVDHGASSLADFDGDGDLDLVITGYNGTYATGTVYFNQFQY